ncbi:MAG: flavin reductase family protein [Microbacterium sp.]|uniref:flavin reductase family protein n=1 Tax=Microbacterium sp. TaxID=51671 RepID=UPI0039E5EE15
MTEPRSGHVAIRPSILYVGTPVMLIATRNPDGSANLAAASSYWALGRMLVIGLEADGQTAANVTAHPELTVSFPQPELWPAVEAIADTTGSDPVPAAKASRYRHVADKFAAAGLTAQESEIVVPPRVAECALQLEAVARRITPGLGDYHLVEAEVVRVHAIPEIVVPGTEHVDPRAWRPTIYSFRHYYGLGQEHGHRPASDVAGRPA